MLTDKACKNATAKTKTERLYDTGGLYLEITPAGGKYWRMKYRFAEKEKRLAIGVYPTVTLSEAREKRDLAKKKLSNGIDPSFAKQEEKRTSTLNAENTFEAIALEWFTNKRNKWCDTNARTILRRLEQNVFQSIGKLPISSITAPMLLSMIRKIENRGAFEVASRTLQNCGQIFRYAIATGRTERDPTPDLRGALQPAKKTHYKALDTNEITPFLQALKRNDARLYPLTRLALEMMMHTFVRTSELIKAKWTEFDLENETWLIPAERMKMRKEHIVPLSPHIMALLREVKIHAGYSEYVFPSQVKNTKHMSNNTMLLAIGRLGFKGRTTGHGFRAMAMTTIKEQLGYRHEVVDRQLAHAHRDAVNAAYDRAQFLTERRKMLHEWSEYLESAAVGKVIVGRFGKTG